MKKRFLAVVMTASMVASLALTGCGGNSSSTSSKSASSQTSNTSEASETSKTSEASSATADSSGEFGTYKLVNNDFGAGEYSLDINSWMIQDFCEKLGWTVDVADNKFSVDNVVTNLQSQLAQNPDGAVMFGNVETVYPSIAKACQDANTPYSFFATPVKDEDLAAIEADPLYAGTVVFDPEEEGALLAEMALEAGCKKAVICAGAVGDHNHDHRVTGFTEAFEAGGGEVLGVARCADPSEGATKVNDLVSANMDADCVFGAGAGYVTAFVTAASNMGLDYKIYGCDVTTDSIGYVVDGKVEVISGVANVTAEFAAILMANYLDGHPLLDEDGIAPYSSDDLSFVHITSENAEAFAKWWPDHATCTIPWEDVQNVLYRYNPDVTYDDFCELLQNYADIVYEQIGA